MPAKPKKPRLSIVGGSAKANAEEGAGLFHDVDALAGTEVFNVYGSNGKRLGRWEAVEGVTDEKLLDALESWLARKDSPRISLLPSGGATGGNQS